MKLLDLFCGAGGAAVGYNRAGFEIVGIDNVSQSNYPFKFIEDDAFDFLRKHGKEFDIIHASPPCQAFSISKYIQNNDHPDLITPLREILQTIIERPYIIENVEGAPLINPLMLCGTMFGLQVIRHRYFEIWPEPIWFPPYTCNHDGKATSAYTITEDGKSRPRSFKDGYKFITVAGHSYVANEGKIAMGIDWMNRDELSQAIPPAYTEWIGQVLLKKLKFKV